MLLRVVLMVLALPLVAMMMNLTAVKPHISMIHHMEAADAIGLSQNHLHRQPRRHTYL